MNHRSSRLIKIQQTFLALTTTSMVVVVDWLRRVPINRNRFSQYFFQVKLKRQQLQLLPLCQIVLEMWASHRTVSIFFTVKSFYPKKSTKICHWWVQKLQKILHSFAPILAKSTKIRQVFTVKWLKEIITTIIIHQSETKNRPKKCSNPTNMSV